MKGFKVIFTAFLIGVTVFSIFKYLLSLKEKQDLLNELNQVKEELSSLQTEKQNLLVIIEKERESKENLAQENVKIKDELAVNQEKLIQVQTAIEELNSHLFVLRAENETLREEEDKLKLRLSEIMQEKENLKSRLSSLPELKKAIKELRMKTRKQKQVAQEAKIKAEKAVEGNRGYLLRDGKLTYPIKIKIQVKPAG